MLDETFEHSYEAEVNPELPGDGKWKLAEVYFPEVKGPVGDYLTVKIKTVKDTYVTHFVYSAWGVAGVWSTPNKDVVLVAAAGDIYWLNTLEPGNRKSPIASTVIQIVAVKEKRLVLLNDEFSLIAINETGLLWQTDRLAIEDLKIIAVKENSIYCTALVDYGHPGQIVIDLRDGKLLGESIQD